MSGVWGARQNSEFLHDDHKLGIKKISLKYTWAGEYEVNSWSFFKAHSSRILFFFYG